MNSHQDNPYRTSGKGSRPRRGGGPGRGSQKEGKQDPQQSWADLEGRQPSMFDQASPESSPANHWLTYDQSQTDDQAAKEQSRANGPEESGGEWLAPLLHADESWVDETPADGIIPDMVWRSALSELSLQMTTATFDTWVRDTTVLAYEDGEFIIGVPNAYARDWLDNRLRNRIKQTLTGLINRSVQVTFRVRSRPIVEDDDQPSTPLEQAAQSPSAPTGATERPREYWTLSLNNGHTFDTFVVGSHNRLAHAAAKAVADFLGQRFNPLFIYGGVGLGKTHLLNAIGNEVQRRGMRVLYCTSEQFTNELILAIRNQTTEEFRLKYRRADLLLIDDIQFIGGKESTQEEFFHTFNQLHSAGRQVVISSDRPPKAIATLEARLRSRFEGGLQADITPPDFETRVAILQAKAASLGVQVPTDVLMLVAERVESNIRELEGALNHLLMQANLRGGRLDLSLASIVLSNLMPQRAPVEPTSVVRIVAEHFRLRPEDLTGRTRTKEIAGARQVAMYLLREDNSLSLPVIGDLLGGRDHSTVRYGVDKVENDLEVDDSLRREVMLLRDKIYAPAGSY